MDDWRSRKKVPVVRIAFIWAEKLSLNLKLYPSLTQDENVAS